jgi:signal transduction histidine kinase/ActR/RegA family two-component response regulator
MTQAGRTSWVRSLIAAWRHHLAVRLVATVVGLSVLLTALASAFALQHEEQFFERELQRQCRQVAEVAALNCGDDLAVAYQDYPRLQDYVDALVAEDSRVRYVQVVRRDGKLVAAAPRSIADAMAEPDVVECRRAIHVEIDGEPRDLGYLQLGMSRRPWREMRAEHFQRLLLGLVGAALLTALTLMALLNRFLGGPLRQLDGQVREIGRGVLDQPVAEVGACELRRLAVTFEGMRRNLQQSYRVLADQNEQLRQLDRLKSEFLANMSHEIRTPLYALLGCTEELATAEQLAPAMRENLQMLQRNAHGLMDTVNSVLDLSKLENRNLLLQPAPADARRAIENLLADLRPTAEAKGLLLELVCSNETPARVVLDEQRFRQILRSLLDNAIKFTERGGVQVVADYVAGVNPPQLRVHVIDSGIGIPDEFRAKLFEPFTQADGSGARRHGGVGLGLALAQRLAVVLGGDLAIDSQQGGGTWVRLRVPAPPAPVTQRLESTEQQLSLKGKRVLVVDDAPDNLKILRALLRRSGAQVETAENGRVACDKVLGAAGERQPFDLVVMDVQMPEMDGCAAVRSLRAVGVHTPIIALTAHAMEQDRVQCLSAGFDEYETKPVERARLLATLERLIQRAPRQSA